MNKKQIITIAIIFIVFILAMTYTCYATVQESDVQLPKQYCKSTGINEVYVASQEVTELPEIELQKTRTSLGYFELTAYCACEKCCGKTDGITATGTQATQGRTIAVDPTVIPYGTHVIINDHEYVAEDCGGAIKTNRIDVYFDSHQDALKFGRQYNVEVFVEKN